MPHNEILSEVEKLEVINQLISTENGLRFFLWLCHNVCNYNVSSVGYENGSVSNAATLFNEARKDIWRTIRPYIIHELLARIETHDVYLTQEELKAEKHKPDDSEEEEI